MGSPPWAAHRGLQTDLHDSYSMRGGCVQAIKPPCTLCPQAAAAAAAAANTASQVLAACRTMPAWMPGADMHAWAVDASEPDPVSHLSNQHCEPVDVRHMAGGSCHGGGDLVAGRSSRLGFHTRGQAVVACTNEQPLAVYNSRTMCSRPCVVLRNLTKEDYTRVYHRSKREEFRKHAQR